MRSRHPSASELKIPPQVSNEQEVPFNTQLPSGGMHDYIPNAVELKELVAHLLLVRGEFPHLRVEQAPVLFEYFKQVYKVCVAVWVADQCHAPEESDSPFARSGELP